MSRADQDSASGGWGRPRLLATLAAGVGAAVLFVAGLALALYYVLRTAEATSTPPSAAWSAGPKPVASGSGPAYRDRVAAAPMLKVAPDDARRGVPAAVTGPVIDVPAATDVGPARVPTGFPRTPQGAVGQLAAIETTVLQGMSIPQANQVYEQWALPGGAGVADWALTKNVQNFLASAGQGQSKDLTVAVTATPAAGQVKGTDGASWVLACVLLDVRATITVQARIGYGYCERMQWHATSTGTGGDGGRWMIAPGAPAAAAPCTWPGTDIAFKAGWRTWVFNDLASSDEAGAASTPTSTPTSRE
ncbi:hypothetical protein SAMN04489867_3139 [Pedococcus dokdonensis]|uniref:Uncharacterized protein n=1 Tax=Pedococcus dokdonensis TaxID=443156 RepID=A0A1H0U569_9MICO|nr:hypothetical protein [Pedococcus dokdonensis]SDP61291.1 hypothetical protein SAMN04489867_3139 [Pedococcus dokdonensis]